MAILPTVSASNEREFQNKNIFSQRERYLATDVLQKITMDAGYAEKVNQVEHALARTGGLILDIGANTCGESEYLTTRGYSIVATDINEIALGLSKERCAKFGRTAPRYISCDAHRLPLQSESVSFAIFNESLHHMEDARQVLREVHRVLLPGGRIFMYEPYAYNPYRRLSEVRDRFLGTIEKKFWRQTTKQSPRECRLGHRFHPAPRLPAIEMEKRSNGQRSSLAQADVFPGLSRPALCLRQPGSVGGKIGRLACVNSTSTF